MKKVYHQIEWIENQIIPLQKVKFYIHSQTGIMPSLWKIKRWIAMGWLRLIQPVGYNRQYKYVMKSEIDKFIKEHTK